MAADLKEMFGIQIQHIPIGEPWKNGRCERFQLTVKTEVFDRIDLRNVNHIQNLGLEYQVHYNSSRPHQALAGLKPAMKSSDQKLILASRTAEFIKTRSVSGLITEHSLAA